MMEWKTAFKEMSDTLVIGLTEIHDPLNNILIFFFQIIHSRINKHITNQYFIWDTFPGSLHISPSYSRNIADYPFYYAITGHQVPSKFTALIYATSLYLRDTSPLYILIQNVAKSPFLDKVKYEEVMYNLSLIETLTLHLHRKCLCPRVRLVFTSESVIEVGFLI